MANVVRTTQRSWESIVRAADGPEYQKEHDQPVVYYFPNDKTRRAANPEGPYRGDS